MRAVVQRVARARVSVDGREISAIGGGLLVLVAAAESDGPEDVRYLADKIANLRIMSDADGRMNVSVGDTGQAVLIVSQFTLIAETRKGRRPSFTGAASPEIAEPLVRELADRLRTLGVTVENGEFGASMDVELINRGPVTIILDSNDRQIPRRGGQPAG